MHNYKLRKLLAKRVRQLMADSLDLQTQAALAERTGVAQTTIGRVIKEQVSATIDNIESIADAFGIEAYELLGGKSDSLSTDEFWQKIEKLPPADRERIHQFVMFAIAHNDYIAKNTSKLNFFEEQEPATAELKEMALKAAGRSISDESPKKRVSLNYETRQKTAKLKAIKAKQ